MVINSLTDQELNPVTKFTDALWNWPCGGYYHYSLLP